MKTCKVHIMIIFLAVLMTATVGLDKLSAQERNAKKDSFVDPKMFVDDTSQKSLSYESSMDSTSMKAKDKTSWVDPCIYVGDTVLTRLTGDNMSSPFVVGTYSAYFTYSDTQNTTGFTNAYTGRPTNDVFYKFTLTCSMEMEFKHCGSGVSDTYLTLLNSSGGYIDHNDDWDGQCSSRYHSYLKINLNAGTYYVVSEGWSANGNITTQITGRPGNNMATAFNAGTITASNSFTNTQNTNNFTNSYEGRPTNDVFYKFTTTSTLNIVISHCGSDVHDTYVTLLSSTGTYINCNDDLHSGGCSDGYQACLIMNNLPAGTYYVVTESWNQHGFITTKIEPIAPGSISPNTQLVNLGNSVTMTHINSTGVISRQWQVSANEGSTWTDVAGVTGTTYTTGTFVTTGTLWYRIKINGNVYSTISKITAIMTGSITPSTQSIVSGNSVTLTHINTNGVTARQWQLSTNNGNTWSNISSATGSTYNTGILNNSGTYKYRVMINGVNVYSAESEITVIASGSIIPNIQTVGTGSSLILTHTGSLGVTSRQWQLSTNNGSTWANLSSGTGTTCNTGTFTSTGTYRYRVRVNGLNVYSTESVITVIICGNVSPVSQTLASGSSVTLTHSGSSGVTARLWQLSTNNGSTWTDITGAISTTYNTGTLTNNGSSDIARRYRVKLNAQNIYSAESVITVNPAPQPGSINPDDQTIETGNSVLLTHTGYTGVTSRQWQLSTNGGSTWTNISGATSTTYNTGTLTNNGTSDIIRRYRVRINGQELYSVVSVITIFPPGVTPSANQNYIHTITPLIETISIPASNRNPSQYSENIKYFDGLGRLMQTVDAGASPDGKDIITPSSYDNFGRESRQYLPYWEDIDNGRYRTFAFTEQQNFYDNFSSNAEKAWSEVDFEPSPLNRVMKTIGAGKDWHNTDWKTNGKFVSYKYKINSTNEVIFWKTNSNINSNGQPYYSAGTLFVTETTDEDGRKVTEYIDLQGRTVRQKQMINTTQDAVTDYVYDNLGRLAYVLPPAINKTAYNTVYLSEPASYNILSEFAQFVYAYRYDDYGRVKEKHIPGAGWTFIVYNKLNQPVLTQDAQQRETNEWAYTKYDAFGRVAITGLYKPGTMVAYATIAQSVYNAAEQYESRGTVDNGYTRNAFPNDPTKCELLTVNYYDDYDFDRNGTPDYSYSGAWATPKGLSTGSLVKVMESSPEEWMTTVTFYDSKARVIHSKIDQPKVDNAIVKDEITNTYSFTGQLLTSTRHHTKGGATMFTLTTANQYDHAGRLKTVVQNIGDGDVTVAENAYNELGQLIQTDLHDGMETIEYAYNIRGWMTKNSSDLFREILHYQDVAPGIGNTPQWAGNISAMEWKLNSWSSKYWHAYKYSYDNLNRLTAGEYTSSATTSDETITYGTNNGYYNEDYQYDIMGNITALNRYNGNASTKVNELIYDYTNSGNRVNQITDTGSPTWSYKVNSNYTYNSAGRMKSDSGKGITNIVYNHFGLPTSIQSSYGATYIYDGTGRKLRAQNSKTYADGVIYEGNSLQFVLTPYGRIRKSGANWIYSYFLKDHLGSVWIVFDGGTASGSRGNVTEYLATMEEDRAAEEKQYFENVDATRADRPFNYPDANPANAKLSKVPGKSEGLKLSLKVMAGDTIEISAKAFYNIDNAMPEKSVNIAPIIGAALAAMTNPISTTLSETTQLANDLGGAVSGNNAALSNLPEKSDEKDLVKPKSGINFVLYNLNLEVVEENAGYLPVNDNINAIQILATDLMLMKESGYLEIFVNNDAQTPVYYDNMRVVMRGGSVTEINAYYPFGNPIYIFMGCMCLDEYNLYRYNGKELVKDERYDYGKRWYDSEKGGWLGPDPMAEKYYHISPYAYCSNNPINRIDPDGMADFWAIVKDKLRYLGNDGVDDDLFKIAQEMSSKEARAMEKSIKNIRKDKASDNVRDAVYGENSSFVPLEIQNVSDQNNVISGLKSLQATTGKEHGSMMTIAFEDNKATLSFGPSIEGTSQDISFRFTGSYENLKDRRGNPVIGTIHSHSHDRGLSGQGMDEQAGKGDMGNVANYNIPWYTVGPTRTHVGYKDPYGRVHHSQVPIGTNILRDALLKTRR